MADNTSDIIAYPFEFQLPFEQDFNEKAALQWMGENWTAAFTYAILYVVLVFGGRYFMQNREKFDLRLPLTLWSGGLAVFSTLGALRSAYDLWYHHITVLLYAWYSYKDTLAAGRWFYCMNFTVHALMYTYYAVRAAGYRVPRSYAMVITLAQTAQMFMGCVVNYTSYAALTKGEACGSTYDNIVWSSVMYFSYFLLFAQFFYDAYMRKPEKQQHEKTHENGVKHRGAKENGVHIAAAKQGNGVHKAGGKRENGMWKENGIKRD
ncbi:ELOVL6 [Branchiostoma lanceolatum]|uniref:Elongation of very long chain fatty acids protein n=1 Tax=Branchiostoma lanceolatum TaxID=7740 RepID=A0A8J9Z4X6_BRALA|nr:ELOVL6 [Branchiostoma lanceolatum]